jgi:hypothetical protein
MQGDATTDERRRNRAELVSIAIMSLATLVTAWCAAQAEAWSGMQIFRSAASNHLFRSSFAAQIEGNQIRMFDATQFSLYAAATGSHDEALSRFLHDRLRPEMRAAVDAWWSTKPLQNATAPATPMLMREYVVPQYARAAELAKAGDACQRDAQTSNDVSDAYMLATVVLACVLLLAGMAPRLGSRKLQRAVFSASGLLLVVCAAWIGTRPIVSVEVRRARLLNAECKDALHE